MSELAENALAKAKPYKAPPKTRGRKGAAGEDGIAEAVARINVNHALVLHGTTALVMREVVGESGRPEISFQLPRDFALWFSTEKFQVDDKKVGIGAIWLGHPDRRQYEGITFIPAGWEHKIGDVIEPNIGGVPGWYNLWRGYAVEPAAFVGDPDDHLPHFSLLADHVRKNIALGREDIELWLWGWAAHLIQRPTERVGATPVLQGRMGTGKSVFGEHIGHLIGDHYVGVSSSRYLVGNFNAHMANCLLLQGEEAFWAGDAEAAGVLKDLVTSKKHLIEGKHRDAVNVRNYIHLLLTSNEDFVVPAGLEERRWAVFRVGGENMQDSTYFEAMQRQMEGGGYAHLLAWLIRLDLARVNLRAIPATQALWEQKAAALPPEQSWWLLKLRDGKLLLHDHEWETEVVTRLLYRSYSLYATELGVRRKKTEEQLAQAMAKLLPEGYPQRTRPWRDVRTDDGSTVRRRERCYVLPPLTECRAHFCRLANWSLDWGEGEGEGDPDSGFREAAE